MPGSVPVLGQGQTVALLIVATGYALLLFALALEHRGRPGTVRTRTRSALVGALLITAGLALLLVRRLDPAALARVLTDVTAALYAAVAVEQQRRRPTTSARVGCLHRHHLDGRRPQCSPHDLSEELS